MIDVCSAENEAEAHAIQELLREHGIDAQILPLQSSSYPGLLHPEWGKIRVPQRELLRARELVEEWRRAGSEAESEAESEVEPDSEAEAAVPRMARRDHVGGVIARTWRIAKPILILASIFANGYLFVKYVWHPQRDEETTTDARGRPVTTFHYRPFDAYAHRWDDYSSGGHHDASWFDDDVDGWAERGEVYAAGKLIWRYEDSDEDGSFETMWAVVDGKYTAELRDADRDERIEETISYRDRKPRAWLYDRDKDGFAEHARCIDARGEIRERNLLACDL